MAGDNLNFKKITVFLKEDNVEGKSMRVISEMATRGHTYTDNFSGPEKKQAQEGCRCQELEQNTGGKWGGRVG